jgi:nicotinate-nucleotide pyrophosphorylase (carboxylating)
MDLEDAAMVKENHLYAAFGHTGPDAIREAAKRCRAALPAGRILYVEVENLAELDAAIEAGADVAMLDGFDLGLIRQAVKRVREAKPPRPLLEITGGVTLENVGAYAASGVQRISIGALTHSAPQLDLSMRVRGEPS